MPSLMTSPAVGRTPGVGLASTGSPSRLPVLVAASAGAWLVVLAAQAAGAAEVFHHHALIENGPPLWLALPLFALAWQVMIAAMMLPASLPAIRAFGASLGPGTRPGRDLAAFVGAYAVIWTVFGLLAFMGDVVLHHIVHAAPWLGARPWLIEAGVLTLAGGYQFAPLKRSSLTACRHPDGLLARAPHPGRGPFWLGLEHGLACLTSSWALMLVMFAAGFANVWWMVLLTVVMVYETTGRHGQRAASALGAVLLLAAVAVLVGPLAA